MGKTTRWIAIFASIFMACAVLSASPAKKKARHHVRHRRTHHYRRHHYRRHRYYRRRVRLPSHPSRTRTRQIQTALARGGYYKGDPNGRWNSSTLAAVRKFQAAHNMDANGKLDAPTLQKLGLGSDIAGVAAPRPIVPKGCCSVGPTDTAPAKPAASPAPASTAPTSAKTQAARTSAASIVPATKSGGTTDSASTSKPAAAQH